METEQISGAASKRTGARVLVSQPLPRYRWWRRWHWSYSKLRGWQVPPSVAFWHAFLYAVSGDSGVFGLRVPGGYGHIKDRNRRRHW